MYLPPHLWTPKQPSSTHQPFLSNALNLFSHSRFWLRRLLFLTLIVFYPSPFPCPDLTHSRTRFVSSVLSGVTPPVGFHSWRPRPPCSPYTQVSGVSSLSPATFNLPPICLAYNVSLFSSTPLILSNFFLCFFFAFFTLVILSYLILVYLIFLPSIWFLRPNPPF